MTQTPEQLYDILDMTGERIHTGFAYDEQCDTYYAINSMVSMRGDTIIDRDYTVIEAGYYTES